VVRASARAKAVSWNHVRKDEKKEPEMKAIQSLVVAAVAAAGMAVTADAQAASGHWGSGRVVSGGHWGGGHWSGGSHWYGPRFGLYVGAPLLFAPWYYGYPYDYYYPRTTVIYRDVDAYPATYPDYPEGYMAPPSTEVAPPAAGAPQQAPAYRNYCESAKAYFPKVTTCPEGWRFEPTR
jgi:hypothetical protein